MSKCIDAKKLKSEIERQKRRLKTSIQSGGDYGQSCTIVAYDNILSIIDTLQQEQSSLPDNIDEAAEKYEDWVESYSQSDFPTCVSFRQAFKAGAEWMAGQMKQEQQIGEGYAIKIGKHTHTLRFGSQSDIDNLIRQEKQEQPEDIVVAAKTFLDALSKTPYNNKPITDAQIIVRQLLLFFENPKEYNPDAILEQPGVDLEKVAEGVVLKFHPIMRECYAMNLGMYEMIELVKSGFELGLNARKEE